MCQCLLVSTDHLVNLLILLFLLHRTAKHGPLRFPKAHHDGGRIFLVLGMFQWKASGDYVSVAGYVAPLSANSSRKPNTSGWPEVKSEMLRLAMICSRFVDY